MKRARTVQLSMLPKTPAIEGLDLFAHYEPCEMVGGDFYDFVPVSPWELGIVVGDVAGHGVDAALTMAVAKKAIQIHGMGRSSPRETLLVTCADLAPDLPGNSFVTVFYGVLDLRDWKLTFASAGHMPPIVYNPDRSPPLQAVSSKGVVMGAAFVHAMEQMLTEQTVNLRRGDTLFLYTDGLTEASNTHDDQFGEPRLLRALDCAGEGGAREIVTSVVNDLRQFTAGTPPQDDLTMLAVRIAGEPKAAARMPQNKRRRTWPTNLRPAKSTFIGRASELAQVQQWLHDEGALATITGGSGQGKSRLALEAGRASLEHLPGGVWIVDASSARDSDQLAQEVARALGVALTNMTSPLEAVATTLEFRPPLLLILDNCEAGERFARPLLERWRSAAPRARFLTTSREAMGIPGERVLQLKPLASPVAKAKSEDLISSDAASLFVARAKEVNPDFAVDDESAPRIAAILRGLDGNPLAIELAAAQANTLNAGQIDDGLRKDRETKRPPTRMSKESRPIVAPEAADWTFDLLSPQEKHAFCQLSLMRGGFFLEAAEAILEAPEDEAALDATEIVQSLLDKQLLQTQDTPYGIRFVLLPPIRSFGRRKRAESFTPEQEDALTGRFVAYFADYARSQEERYASRAAGEVLDRLELDLDNIFAAQDFALAMNRPELAARAILGASPLFGLRNPTLHRAERINRALSAIGPGGVTTRVRLLTALSQALYYSDKWDEALAKLDEAIALCTPGLNDSLLARALSEKSFVLIAKGDFAAARGAADLALKVGESVSDPSTLPTVLVYSGWVAYQERRSELALSSYERAEPSIRAHENLPLLVECLNSKGIVLRALGRVDEALACAQEAMELLRKLNAPLAIGVQVGNIGVIFRFLERLDEALDCFLQSEAALRDAGERHGLTRTLGHIADLYIVLEHFDQAQGYATESLDLANRANDRLAISRGEQLLGHMAMFQKKYAEALGHYERTVAAERELKRMIELALALAFCTLCRVEIGQAEAALRDINEASLILGSVTVRKASPGFLLTACQAKVQFALGQREQAALTLKEALEKANRDNLGHYSSDMVLLMAWQAIDALRAAGLGDPNTAHEIRVQCEHCHARVRGTRKHVDDLIACPACKTAPFRYFVGE